MLATILLAALTATPAFPAPGAYHYTASLNGKPLGEWGIEVERDDRRTEVDETSTASMGGLEFSAKATLVLGPDLSPATYDGTYQALGQNPTVSVALTPTQAVVTASQSAAPLTLTLGASTRHFAVIEPMLLAGLFALPAQLVSWKDSSVTWVSPMRGEAKTLRADSATGDARPANVPANDVELSLAGDVPVTMWYDPASLVPDRILVPSQNAVLTRVR